MTLIVGTMMSKYIWNVAPPPGEASLATIRLIRTTTDADIPVNDQFAGSIVVMVGLCFVWGVVYHFSRH